MSMMSRAAQFAPFAALSGHNDAINETARLTSNKIELSTEESALLSRRLSIAISRINEQRPITFTYFVHDLKKSGGKYVVKTAPIKKVDEYERLIVLTDGTAIPFDDLLMISFI